jgi:2-polyprenyl-3-methyl-5-hydroxy-6-metoxy-1,4-benzoquinol methylase
VFATYQAHRARSSNPNDTIEEPALVAVLGDVRGLRVLDLGCGDGRFGVRLLSDGCAHYVGVEASRNMLRLAQQALDGTRGVVHAGRIEDFAAEPASFDVIVRAWRCTTSRTSSPCSVARSVRSATADGWCSRSSTR